MQQILYLYLKTPTEQESMETSPPEVKPDVADADAPAKPFWMKSKLVGGENSL